MTPFLLSLLAASFHPLPAVVQHTERVSVNAWGLQGNGPCENPTVSQDGRFVAFSSAASHLVSGDTNQQEDIFVHDRQTGQTTRVSVDSGGLQANRSSVAPSISSDGRCVAFESSASNLVPGDTNDHSDIFVHDRQTGQTTRVSVDSGGVQGTASSYEPSTSADGRFVAFRSFAPNLVPADTNGFHDIFVHDRLTGLTTRVSVDSGGLQGNRSSLGPRISSDGRFVGFYSDASNLVPFDTNTRYDTFVHDRLTGQTTRVSVRSDGLQGHNDSTRSSISSDGRFVAFESSANNLVPGDTNSNADVFVHDRQTGQTTRVSVDSGGLQGESNSILPSISSNGRFVSFESYSDNLVPGDTNRMDDIFVHDRQTGQTTRVSVDSGGLQANLRSSDPSISAGGRFVAFVSAADNLVPGDTNDSLDIFVHDRQPITPTLAAHGSCPGPMTLTLDAATPEGGVAFALGGPGSFTLTSSVCAGTVLDLAHPRLGPVIRASWLGTIARSYPTTPAMCGRTVQALDVHSCKTSNTVVL